MSRLYITCYRSMAIDDFGRLVAAPMTPPLAEDYIEITHESKISTPFPLYTSFICIKADADCHIDIGDEPTADQNYHLISAGERLFYGAQAGHQVSVIEAIT